MNRRIAMVGISVFVVAVAGERMTELGHEQYAQLPNRARAAPHDFHIGLARAHDTPTGKALDELLLEGDAVKLAKAELQT